MDTCALVLAGGDPVDAALRNVLPDADLVVAADSGLHLAAPLGLKVDRIVGDLDSADLELVDAAVAAGAVVERHAAAKDATDLELAIDAAVRDGACRIVVVGGAGGRVDHFLANVLLLAAPELHDVRIDAYFGGARTLVAHGGGPPREFGGLPGSIVTLLPVGGVARDIVTTGLEYALAREDLEPGSSRGVSNVMTGTEASVVVGDGTLIVVQPDAGTGALS
jgi:thiamine pyrophosphokinase